MCDAATLAVTSFVIEGIKTGAEYAAQRKAANQNTKAATENLLRQYAALNTRQTQEQKALSQDIQDVGSQVAQATGTAVTSAGEAGVSGLSVDLLVQDYRRQQATATDRLNQNYEITSDQIQQEKESARLGAIDQINQVPQPSLLPGALKIGAAGLNLYGQHRIRKKAARSGTNTYDNRDG